MARHKTVKCPECGHGVKHHRFAAHLASAHPTQSAPVEAREILPGRDAALEREMRRMKRETTREYRLAEGTLKGKRRSALKPVLILVAIAVPLILLYSFGPGLNIGVPGVGGDGKNTSTHQHPHIEITIQGQEQTIPVNIGISSSLWADHALDEYGGMHGQMSPLHTHGTDGTIHVEMKSYHDCTLGDFFDVWGQPFDEDTVMSYTGTVQVTVDGREVGKNEHRGLVLQDGQKIVITGG